MDEAKIAPAARRRILVVDDEEINREILCAFLSDDYDLICCANGEEAWERLTQGNGRFSLVFLDLMMPVMDGVTFLKKKQEDQRFADLPVIVLTADSKKEVECLRLGALDFIKKPYESAEIVRARVWRIIELYESSEIISRTSIDKRTGLYSREYFDLYAAAKIEAEAGLDLVTIHIANHTVLYEISDAAGVKTLMRQIGRFLAEEGQSKDAIASLRSEDTFYLLCKPFDDYEAFLDRLRQRVRQLHFGAKIRFKLGVYSNVDQKLPLGSVLERAMEPTLSILRDSKVDVKRYDAAMHENTMFQERLIHQLDSSLKNHDFKVFLQAKYDITGEKPRPVGAEALVRWIHPEQGMISPGVFVPLFERSGHISQIDRFVYDESARILGRLKKEFGLSVPISVNVSRSEVLDPTLKPYILSLVEREGIDPALLHLEITESAFSDDKAGLIGVVSDFRRLGFCVELDDFGSGYSSLNTVCDLPFDILKLDMGFIRSMERSKKNEKVVQAVVDLGKILGVKTVAEGVETALQVETLKRFGCDYVQGYYFSKPLPEEEFLLKIQKELSDVD